MLKVIIDLATFLVMPISGFFVIKNLTGSDEKIYSLKNVLILFLLVIANALIYNIEYKYMITLVNFFFLVLGYKFIFKKSFFQSLILTVVLIILAAISDVVLYIIMSNIFEQSTLKETGIVMLISNILVGVVTVLLSKIKTLIKFITNLLLKFNKNSSAQFLLISSLWIFIISLLCYSIVTSPINSFTFWIGICIEVVFIVFMLNYFRDKYRYISLNEKFDDLYNYIQTMEEYIDSEKLNIHEYKNQLSVIKSMTNNKKIKEYIDSLVVETKIEGEWSSELKTLPKGGLKGLLYYKLAQASSKGINVLVTVSKDCNAVFKKFSLEETKQLSRLVGIYMDNAIEATANTKKKNLTLEIYKIKGNVNIVISNSIEEDIDLKQVTKKGFSSKGKGRGNGLYLAKKMLAKNTKIEAESKILNGFYVQKIIIK